MARLNTRPSIVGEPRAGTPNAASNNASDQENRDPRSQRARRGKNAAMSSRSSSPPSLPTPASGENNTLRGQKRKRNVEPPSGTQMTSGNGPDEDEERFNKYFDPNQDPEARRQTKREARALEREFNENRDEYLRNNGEALTETINRANHVFKNIKQTNDATLDSRLLVNVSDLAYKKTAQLVLEDSSTGIDVDLFLSKCITFMRNGGPLDGSGEEAPVRSQRRRRTGGIDSEDEDNIGGQELDWELLGQHACFPYNSRPPVPSFLLGPLSVEKKQRAQTQRRARQTRNTDQEVRPEALTREDLTQSDESGLTAICTRISAHLNKHVEAAEAAYACSGLGDEGAETARGQKFLKDHRVTITGGPSLFDYAVNPHSFGQTVENLFYISFLIKEGAVGVDPDENGLPTLLPCQPHDLEDQRKLKISKHQAVFGIDYATWQTLIEAFDIKEPLIPHREDDSETRIGSRGWYA